ncbi:hypothetical protein FMEAI12_3080030 [Parafrankia sp. Ea1.12]|nr:hypothetical protein FMEAI12_3080030 [Parafrankia sp. Ea1.12]
MAAGAGVVEGGPAARAQGLGDGRRYAAGIIQDNETGESQDEKASGLQAVAAVHVIPPLAGLGMTEPIETS